MTLNVQTGPSSSNATAVGIPYFEDGSLAVAGAIEVPPEVRKRRGFEGKAGQVTAFDIGDQTVFAIGLGKSADLDVLRRASAALVKAAGSYSEVETRLASVAVDGATEGARSQAIAEGALLGFYKFSKYKDKGDERKLAKLTLVDADESGVTRGTVIADAVNLARDLGNMPPGDMNPTHLAEVAERVANENNLSIIVWDELQLQDERMGGVLGVAAGSDQPPRFVQMKYEPSNPTATIALIGKGITFDSGGLSLKPNDGMATMKTDMSGAANVIAAMSAIAKLKPDVRVLAYAPLTENMPGPSATKLGDVLHARNGKTMEVLNTDAEGRLVLADALSVAVEQKPDAIIDVATLTGACVVALGSDYAGLWANNDPFKAQVLSAAAAVDELLWEMPLPDRYRKLIDSDVADIKNIGGRMGGAITAALFLKEFVGDIPWVHLDVAGPSRSDSDDGYTPKGSTGFSVRTMIQLAEGFERP